MDSVSSNPESTTDSKIKDLTDRLSALEGLSGGKSKEGTLRRQLEETLNTLREVRAALKTESGDLESVKAANEEADKLREALKRKDYRILHLTRALDELSSSSGQSTAGVVSSTAP